MSNVLNNLTKTKWKGEFNEVVELETLTLSAIKLN